MSAGSFPASRHNHDVCAARALEAAERIAQARGARLTRLRHYVLEMVLSSHKPVGAYDILAALVREDAPAKPSPPTVYRALDFLIAQGFIHRVDSLNAYAGCFSPERAHHSRFLLCRGCGRAAEIDDPDLDRMLHMAAQSGGFDVERETVELTGLCPECRERV